MRALKMLRTVVVAILLLYCTQAHSGEADVVDVEVTADASGSFNFDVTVAHADAGWSHYANRWEVIGLDGFVYATRELAHPHDEEQPFTRSVSGVVIPHGIQKVALRAHDLVHAYGGQEMTVDLPGR
jgi:peroxiredoxin